jgi:DNA-binding PadR family transcriptional regulator
MKHHYRSYGSAHLAIKKMVSNGLLKVYGEERNLKNALRKTYVLTETGRKLLTIFGDGEK